VSGDNAVIRVLGTGTAERAAPDWPPLTEAEVAEVVANYFPAAQSLGVRWRSPRPLSTAAIIETSQGKFFLKRNHESVRDAEGVREEHRFIAHLRAHGAPVADIVRNAVGDTVTNKSPWHYELHTLLPGADAYRDRNSWTPYLSDRHAFGAGVALAQTHLAAANYWAPPRPHRPLLVSSDLFCTPDPITSLEQLAHTRPALGKFLESVPWQADFERVFGPLHAKAYSLESLLAQLWTHNDWHPSNLMWTGDQVSGIFDFGLANLTTAVHDLATAIERAGISWIAPERTVHLDNVKALLRGYESVRPLGAVERHALPDILPLVHANYALSEIDYFIGALDDPAKASWTYHEYFLGHAQWFHGPGVALQQKLAAFLEGHQ
jgi:Ser/Thr protein kinase RdoA (MazF antagonist)